MICVYIIAFSGAFAVILYSPIVIANLLSFNEFCFMALM